MAHQVQGEAEARTQAWSRGFSRRQLLAGGMGVGVMALGAQLVTSRVSFAAPGQQTGTLVVVFLRGGMDGLNMLVPVNDNLLQDARPGIAVPSASLIGLDSGFGLHPGLAPLQDLISKKMFAAVPAIATPELTRSHFQAQDCLERGGSAAGGNAGWLDRALQAMGEGTTFRSVSGTSSVPRSQIGENATLGVRNLKDFRLRGPEVEAELTRAALEKLYTGLDHPMSAQTLNALVASDAAQSYSAADATPSERGYPDGNWGTALASIGTLIRHDAGVRVATVDLGGWDMHTGIGNAESGQFREMTNDLASGLAAFVADIGPKIDQTTVLVMSEFGRRVEQNGSGGTDHGHGGVAMVMGGGVAGGVKGKWEGLSEATVDRGDVPGTNDYRDLLSEVVVRRLGVSEGQLSTVFPDWNPTMLGVMR
ncbi:MAG: hypothetical protein CSA58_00050 [Micrococcales bacterium]|nr:MAG: hypothetical protein CSA58_00050 [Micrococcales bacterium]